MFSIHTDTFAGFTRYQLLNSQTGEYLTLIPECGAILQELVLRKNNQLHALIDGVTADELPANTGFKSGLLFPFPSRIPDGRYQFEGKTYQLPINEASRHTALHGFMADKPFQVVDKVANELKASLQLSCEYGGELTGYPFPFVLKISYELFQEQRLMAMHIAVKNTGETAMPFGFGWHPYFTLGAAIDTLALELPGQKYYETDDRLIPTGKFRILPKSDTLSGKAFDHSFRCRRKSLPASLVYLCDRANKLKIGLQLYFLRNDSGPVSGEKYYFQVYTPSHRQSIALEPQTCAPNAFNTKDGLMTLTPGKSWSGSLSVSLE